MTRNPNRSSGFSSWADFAFAVRRAATDRYIDPRLLPQAAAPSLQGQEAVGSDGGYAAPPDLRMDVAAAVLAETSLLGRTDRQVVKGTSLVVPADAAPAFATTGPQVTLEPEAAPLGQSKPGLSSRVVKLNKLQVTVPVTNELFEDAAGLSPYLRRVVSERLDFAVTNWLLTGDGALKPLGVLNSAALITQTKEGAQGAGTVQYANLQKMWSRLWGPSKSRAVWIMHSSVEQALQGLTLPPGVLTYPPDSPYGFLFGRPMLLTEAAQVIGTVGDLILLDPKALLTATRDGVVAEDLSMHVWFDLDLSAFRFTMRLGAVPWWAAPVTQLHGGGTVSTMVALEAR
jgi:HK97 family phage major capsid protein